MKRTTLALTIALSALSLMPVVALAQDSPGVDSGSAQVQTPPSGDHIQSGAGGPGAGGWQGHRHGGHGFGEGGGGPFSRLSTPLSADQQKQMADVRAKMQADAGPLREKIQSLRAQLQADPQGKNSADLQNQLSALKQQMHDKMKANREQMDSILTEQQRNELASLRAQRREGGRHGFGGANGGGANANAGAGAGGCDDGSCSK